MRCYKIDGTIRQTLGAIHICQSKSDDIAICGYKFKGLVMTLTSSIDKNEVCVSCRHHMDTYNKDYPKETKG